jgi:uncharacterized protein YjbJ (UPF0337 family)
MWNKDEVEGKGKQIKGTIKDKTGEVVGNHELEAEGEAEHSAGKAQESVGEARRKVGETIEKAGEKIAGR